MVVRRIVVVSIAVMGLAASGCTSDDPGSSEPAAGDDSSSQSFDFGQPADVADVDRVIDIETSDDLAFDPENVQVEVGEVITFKVTNAGDLPHEFTLGPEDVQQEHEDEMAEMNGMEMDGDANAIAVPAGSTSELTWQFPEPGTVLFGCHVTGHYAAGMVGEIDVADGSA